jgi:3-isopropylmalate dehydratase small subunit
MARGGYRTVTIRGQVWKYGDNVDTDVIIPARYLNVSEPAELARHCLEDLDRSFASSVRPGDIVVAGANFGCGSSREHAPLALKAAGVGCVVAESFARIFYRNAINIGLPIVECGEAVRATSPGEVLEVDLERGEVRNVSTGQVFRAQPYPPFMIELMAAGGLVEYTRRREGWAKEEAPAARRVAFQGERGAYSEAAVIALYGEGVEAVPLPSFEDVFRAVQEGACELGVVPIENSLAGSIHRNYDLLLEHRLYIVGEVDVRVEHQLIANPGVKLEEVRRIYSHPQALAQCEQSLATLSGVELVPTYDTAGSVKMIQEQGLQDAAAIASLRAAELYGMQVLRSHLEDAPDNYTRFLALARTPVTPTGPSKTSLVFSAPNVPGSLFKALSVFALRDIDLTKIESRPQRGKPWEYLFYIDFDGSLQEERCRRAVDHLGEIASFLRVFGSYPRAARMEQKE